LNAAAIHLRRAVVKKDYPTIVFGNVYKMHSQPPQKPKNKDVRSREHLTPDEVEALMLAAKREGRHGHRDATLILLMYRHGLRVSEAIALRWDQVDLKQGLIYVNRLKKGTPATHPLRGPELRALRQLQRQYTNSPYLFQSERKGPLTDRTVRHIFARAGEQAGLSFPVHPHMLRHATGYYLASNGQDTRAIQAYLGHKNIQHTVRYTELSPKRFKNFWQD
jgi:type 1 fimbriae regulatory protein FimE